jgi:hypothetical protein
MGDLTFGLLRSIAGSPFYKEVIRQAINEFFIPETVERETREVLFRDVEFTVTSLALLPKLVNTCFGVARGFNRFASSFTPDTLYGMLSGVINDFDARYAAMTVNEYFDLLEKLRESHPALMADLMGDKIEEFIDGVDFGKLRKCVEDSAFCFQKTMEIVTSKIIADPVKFANIAAAIPSVVNSSLAITSDIIGKIEIAPETLASATFSILNEVDGTGIGKLLNETSSLVNRLHEGNYILGRGEPEFRNVAEKLFTEVFETLEVEEVKKAFIALLEDFEVIIQALNDAAWKNPMIAITAISVIPDITNSVIRACNSTIAKFEELPNDVLAQAINDLISEIDYEALGKLVTSWLRTLNSVFDQNPELLQNIVNGILQSIDKSELERATNYLVSSIMKTLLSNPEILVSVVNPVIQTISMLVKTGGENK